MTSICLAPPVLLDRVIVRSRLLRRLDELRDAPVIWVRAPAGYGKTILLAQHKAALDARRATTAWLSADALHDAAALTHLLAAAAGVAARDTTAIGRHLSATGTRLHLFVDDADRIARDALAALIAIIDRFPLQFHAVIASRGKLKAPLGRFRAQGKLVQLGARAIAFDSTEAAGMLGHLEKSERAKVLMRMGGWPAALDLAARRPAGRAQLVSGRSPELAEFLSEELLDPQPPEVRRFLFETALLPSLDAALCDAVCGITGSAQMLALLECEGLPVFPANEERAQWRYHPLFAEFLRDTGGIGHAHARDLRQRAADWYLNQGDALNALEQLYAAGDVQDYAALLDARCEQLSSMGKILAVEKHARRLDADTIARLPNLMLTLALLNARQFRFDEAERMLELATTHIETLDDNDLRLLAAHRRTALAAARGQTSGLVERSEKLVKAYGGTQPYLTCALYAQMIYAHQDRFQMAEFNRIEPRARAALRHRDTEFAGIGTLAAIGVGLFAAGRVDDARKALEQSRDAAGSYGSVRHIQRMTALATLPLAEIHYERNELAMARDLLGELRLDAPHFCFSEQMISGYLTGSRIAQSAGDDDAALDILTSGMRRAWESSLDRLRHAMMHEQVRLLLRTGRPADAWAIARSEKLGTEASDHQPGTEADLQSEFAAVTWARLQQSSGHLKPAITVASRWRGFCANRGAILSTLRWNILLAPLHSLDGNANAAQRAIREAVANAAPAHLVRPFLDEGTIIGEVLIDCYQPALRGSETGNERELRFIRDLLDGFGLRICDQPDDAPCGEGLYGRVGSKEIEILNLVGRGLRNREIGERLGLTEGTVKWYMQQIYDKLGVRRRPQAVERARSFGILA